MGVNITSQIIYDGQKNTTWQFTGQGDGLGDVTNQMLVDRSKLALPVTTVKIMTARYTVSFGILQLLWDAAIPVPFLNLEGFDHIDYRHIGGLSNGPKNAVPPDDTATGNILFSTIGFELNSSFTLVLELVKNSGFIRP